MNLILSNSSPLNARYMSNGGGVMFKVDTPSTLVSSRVSTITSGSGFGEVGQVEHNSWSSSVLRFGGMEVKAKNYFRKDGRCV